MRKEGKWRIAATALAVILFGIILLPHHRNASDNPAQEIVLGEGWSISGVRGRRNSKVTMIEGTDELIYVTYEKESCIDAYDLTGEFQFAIQLPDARNGLVAIDCRDGILIAESKNNVIYLFRGKELLECMDYDEARARDLIPVWGSTDSDYRFTRTHVVRAHGEELFELPPELAKNHNRRLTMTEEQLKLESRLILIGFAVLWLSIVGYCLWSMIRGFRRNQG
jgi:hypothetical protein